MWNLIVSVPDHCLSFTFLHVRFLGKCVSMFHEDWIRYLLTCTVRK